MEGMKDMKKKLIIAIALVLIAFGAYRGTLAIFREETSVDAPINAGKLGIEIINSSTKKNTNGVLVEKIMPGATIEDPVSIQNSKEKDLYVRVTLTKYWVDENDKKLTSANAAYINPIFINTNDWLVMHAESANEEIVYFYHKGPIRSKDTTTNLIEGIEFDSEIDGEYKSYKANIKLEAEAVQTIAAQDAMLSQWGIEVTFDGDGNIVEITE